MVSPAHAPAPQEPSHGVHDALLILCNGKGTSVAPTQTVTSFMELAIPIESFTYGQHSMPRFARVYSPQRWLGGLFARARHAAREA